MAKNIIERYKNACTIISYITNVERPRLNIRRFVCNYKATYLIISWRQREVVCTTECSKVGERG